MVKVIGETPVNEFKAVADGSITANKPIAVTSEGKVKAISSTSQTESLGSQAKFETNDSQEIQVAYDSNADKYLIVYKSVADGNKGKCTVASVSGTTVTYSSTKFFDSGWVEEPKVCFDSTNNKIVIAYRDRSNAYYGTAIVGTISGTTVTFGTEVVFESANSSQFGIDFDSNSGKVVIAYRDNGNSYKGTAIVGTVSGTSISFGSPTIFHNANTRRIAVSYDATADKTIVAYSDQAVSDEGQVKVGTVSGTSISFGSAVGFTSSTEAEHIDVTYDSDAGKTLLVYTDTNDSANGKIRTVNVSNTTPSFGTAVNFETGSALYNSIAYDTTAKTAVICYIDSSTPRYRTATVSGDTITLGTEQTLDASTSSDYTDVAVDGSGNALLVYSDDTTGHGSAKALQIAYTNNVLTSANYLGVSKHAASDGENVAVDIIGAVNDGQSSLTVGNKYYVQNDGTLSTTADSPSVLAGTAISATELLVKE